MIKSRLLIALEKGKVQNRITKKSYVNHNWVAPVTVN